MNKHRILTNQISAFYDVSRQDVFVTNENKGIPTNQMKQTSNQLCSPLVGSSNMAADCRLLLLETEICENSKLI